MPPSRCAASGATRLDAPRLDAPRLDAPRLDARRDPTPRDRPTSGSSEIRAWFVLRDDRERQRSCPGLWSARPCPGAARPDPRGARKRRRRLGSFRSTNPARNSEKPGPRRSSVGTRVAAGSSNVHLCQRCTATARWSTAPAVVASGYPHEAHSRRRRAGGDPAQARTWRGHWKQSGGRHSARWASRTSPVARRCQRCNSIGNLGTTASATSRREGWSASPAGVSSRAGSAAGRSCGPGACAPSRSGRRPQGWPPC